MLTWRRTQWNTLSKLALLDPHLYELVRMHIDTYACICDRLEWPASALAHRHQQRSVSGYANYRYIQLAICFDLLVVCQLIREDKFTRDASENQRCKRRTSQYSRECLAYVNRHSRGGRLYGSVKYSRNQRSVLAAVIASIFDIRSLLSIYINRHVPACSHFENRAH